MKNIKYNIITWVSLVFVFTTSCNDILDETPDNRTTIDSIEKISELLVGAYPEGAYVPFLEPMSDNAGDKGPSAGNYRVNEEMFFWNDLNDTDEDTPTNYWNQAYEAIAQANQALVSIEELGGGSKFDAQRGEALLCRAYTHFMLVSIFSKAYDPATASSDLGIPYVLKPETILLGDYSRGTVAEVYANIQKDLEEGLQLITDDYTVPTFHFTKQAASAFASRFYLNMGEWQKVIDHSTLALGVGGAGVLRDWENEYRPRTYSEQVLRYASSTLEPANLLIVSAYSLYDRFHFRARYQLDSDKRDIIFPAANGTGQPWSYTVFGTGDLFYNIPKFDEYFKVTDQAANTGLPFVTFVLLTTDEALLNRAEAYAMLGQLDNAIADINMSYSVKTRSYNPASDALLVSDVATRFAVTEPTLYTPFYNIPAEALPFVNAVLTIKRTIFYNDGLRWFDNKRHNMAIEHIDFFGNSFLLPKGDNRRQIQIPETAQSFGIEANPR
ncbi:RagB/SusD family nutrient uptake outer membrane protein [Flavivirga spongiicola]|uniref:RagB/SusD family nutrient uptake outer membrane protein n=1 Tax=Flavivirga spongiicola TaxID=421621 RepID=A0ABU7XW23_9FLAO|nr:RagB/SusD family nutrient uptake outer membrane protein [Flavivirga sp. MEBiC05379]MDO5979768.1 RagB/SusD family nutrient uptake outer membrane protein [Flavivirga sp. MEBiC05379]